MEQKRSVKIRQVRRPSMAGAIRAKCLDCCGGLRNEVRDCWAENCPLYPYRFGANPAAAIRQLERSYRVELTK